MWPTAHPTKLEAVIVIKVDFYCNKILVKFGITIELQWRLLQLHMYWYIE